MVTGHCSRLPYSRTFWHLASMYAPVTDFKWVLLLAATHSASNLTEVENDKMCSFLLPKARKNPRGVLVPYTASGPCQVLDKCIGIHSGLYDKPRENVKKQRHHLADKGLSSQSRSFSSSHVRMWELDYKEGWVQKNLCFETVVLEKTLENPLDCKEINQSILKENSPEYSLEGLMLKLKLWYFSRLTGKDPDAEKDWRQEGKGTIEDEMVGWHH